jgi:hypothetical protein
MIAGKLRIAPTCYHVLHLVPVMTAHEMNYFYVESRSGTTAAKLLSSTSICALENTCIFKVAKLRGNETARILVYLAGKAFSGVAWPL